MNKEKKQVKSNNLKSNQNKKKKTKSCCLISLIVVVVFIFLILPSLVAATGIINVPLLSRVLYHSKRPETKIEQSQNLSDKTELKFESIRIQEGKPMEIVISEKELNAYFSTKILGSVDLLQEPLILLHSGEIEFWALFEKSIVKSDLNIVLKPIVKDNLVRIEVKKAKAGAIPLPKSILERVSEEINNQLEKEMQNKEGIELQKIIVEDKELTIVGKMKN